MNSSNGIGRLRLHNPPGERKSGMPHSVEMPAPVNGTIDDASAIKLPSASTPLRRSGAITGIPDLVKRADYSTPRLCRLGDRLLRRARLFRLLDLGDGSGFRLLPPLSVLRGAPPPAFE